MHEKYCFILVCLLHLRSDKIALFFFAENKVKKGIVFNVFVYGVAPVNST